MCAPGAPGSGEGDLRSVALGAEPALHSALRLADENVAGAHVAEMGPFVEPRDLGLFRTLFGAPGARRFPSGSRGRTGILIETGELHHEAPSGTGSLGRAIGPGRNSRQFRVVADPLVDVIG